MAWPLEMLQQIGTAIPQFVLNEWAALLVVLAVVVVLAQYRRVAGTQAELYGVWIHSPWDQLWKSLAAGAAAGLAGSAVFVLTGVGLVEAPGAVSALLFLWPVSIALGAVNPRFICYAYSGALVSLSHLMFGWPTVDVPSVLGLVGLLHMVEALLIWMNGSGGATPMSVLNPRGETVPGFSLERFWPVPLVLPLFAAVGGAPVDMPAWWPVLRPGSGLMAGAGPLEWQLMPVVVVMGYSDLAISAPPGVRSRQSSRVLLLYSGMLLALAVGASYYPPLMWLGALFSALGHEAMAVWSGRVQLLSEPYLKRPHRGVGILDVLPGSLAAAGGLRSGAVILTVEDREVHSAQMLHEALLAAPGYVRIMYRQGRVVGHCRLPRPPEGLLGLGVICLPEPGQQALARMRSPAFFRSSTLEK